MAKQTKTPELQNWKLPHNSIVTNRYSSENFDSFARRHEFASRTATESELVKTLDFLNSLPKTKKITEFLNQYKDELTTPPESETQD